MTLTHDQQAQRQRLVDAMRDVMFAMEVLYDQRTADWRVGTVSIDEFRQYYRQLATLRQAILDLTAVSQMNDPHNPIWFNARDTYYWCLDFVRSGGQMKNARPGQQASHENWSPDSTNWQAYHEALRKAGLL